MNEKAIVKRMKAAAQPVVDSFTPEAEDDEDLPF